MSNSDDSSGGKPVPGTSLCASIFTSQGDGSYNIVTMAIPLAGRGTGTRDNPYEHLKNFYQARGIKEGDLEAKMKAMSEIVVIPRFDYQARKPALGELEVQWLKDQGYSL